MEMHGRLAYVFKHLGTIMTNSFNLKETSGWKWALQRWIVGCMREPCWNHVPSIIPMVHCNGVVTKFSHLRPCVIPKSIISLFNSLCKRKHIKKAFNPNNKSYSQANDTWHDLKIIGIKYKVNNSKLNEIQHSFSYHFFSWSHIHTPV